MPEISKEEKFSLSLKRTWQSFKRSLPILLSVVFLIGFLDSLVPKSFYKKIFFHHSLLDSFIGALVGSFSAGNPITSYILAGEFLKEGVSLVAVLSFIVSWVTVGVIQMPAEAVFLDRRFALVRNLISFIFAIIIAFLTVLIIKIL